MKKALTLFLLLSITSLTQAKQLHEHINEGNQAMQNTFNSITKRDLQEHKEFVDNNTKIDKKMRDEINNFYNKDVQVGIEKSKVMSNYMDFDTNTGKITFNEDEYKKHESNKSAYATNNSELADNGIFQKNERVYVFVSSSIPMDVLHRYKDFVRNAKLGSSIKFVIRGCVPGGGFNGCKDIEPTLKFAHNLMVDVIDKKKNKMKGLAELLIDPVLFKTYEVTRVPSIVLATNVNKRLELGSEGDFSRLDNKPTWWKSDGDWSLEYHLHELAQMSKIERLMDNF